MVKTIKIKHYLLILGAVCLMNSDLSKFLTNMDVGTKVKKWDATYIEMIKKGYAYVVPRIYYFRVCLNFENRHRKHKL